MNTRNKQHHREIDIAKGIAIMLVVLGHCLVNTNGKVPSGTPSIITQIIYSFHVALFFFLSGVLAHKTLNYNGINGNYILKRFKRLIIPYFVCGIIFIIMQIVHSKIVGEQYLFSSLWKIVIGINPYYNLWFLYVLFVLSLIGAVFVRKKNVLFVVFISLALSIVGGMYVVEGSNALNIPLKILKYGFFYYLGMYCGNNYETIKKHFNIKTELISIVIFVLGNVLTFRLSDGIMKSFLGEIISFSGIAVTLAIAVLLCKIKVGKVIEYIGINCMGVFVISGFILPIIQTLITSKINLSYFWATSIYFISTLLISLAVAIIVKKVKILRILVLGEEK